ncbi:MAG: TetR/AcrR family transcriptional regulator [Pseudomonadota bacterium]
MAEAAAKGVTKRKVAQQERSRAKVQLILDTTLQMLNEGPADRITTNEIASRAGISIGSLYQFFPRKEAIFYELFSQWLQDTLDRLDDVGARFDGSEDLGELSDAVFECLTRDDTINSRGHWQLLRAMGSTEELVALEAEHQQEVFRRIVSFQKKFGRKIPPSQTEVLAALQHHVTVGCLATAALVGDHAEREQVLAWGRKTMQLVYDIEKLNSDTG